MDFQEALKYLKIRPGTLRDWIRLRRIPFHRAGRRILFRARDLDVWLEALKRARKEALPLDFQLPEASCNFEGATIGWDGLP